MVADVDLSLGHRSFCQKFLSLLDAIKLAEPSDVVLRKCERVPRKSGDPLAE